MIVRLINSTICVEFIDELDEKFDSYVLKEADRKYKLFLKKEMDIPVIVHELWHIYMDCLATMDLGKLTCTELSSDIYAYSFENLLKDIISLY